MKNLLTRAGEFELKDVSPKERTITGLITTNAVDRYGEIVEPAGVLLTNYRKNPVVLLNHITWNLPIGRNLWIKEDGNGLLAKTQFADTAEGLDTFRLYDEGFMKAWSIGFLPKRWEDGNSDAGFRRKFLEWELLEYSAVTVPANQEAVSNALAVCESPRVREMLGRGSCVLNPEEAAAELHSLIDELQKQRRLDRAEIEELKDLVAALQVVTAEDGGTENGELRIENEEKDVTAHESHTKTEDATVGARFIAPSTPQPAPSTRRKPSDLEVLGTKGSEIARLAAGRVLEVLEERGIIAPTNKENN